MLDSARRGAFVLSVTIRNGRGREKAPGGALLVGAGPENDAAQGERALDEAIESAMGEGRKPRLILVDKTLRGTRYRREV